MKNKSDEMVDILSHLDKYVPTRIETKVHNVPDTEESEDQKMSTTFTIGGD